MAQSCKGGEQNSLRRKMPLAFADTFGSSNDHAYPDESARLYRGDFWTNCDGWAKRFLHHVEARSRDRRPSERNIKSTQAQRLERSSSAQPGFFPRHSGRSAPSKHSLCFLYGCVCESHASAHVCVCLYLLFAARKSWSVSTRSYVVSAPCLA